MEYRRGDERPQSGLVLAARITLPHFSFSSAMNLPKSAGEVANTVWPKSANRAFIEGSTRAALISLLSFSMMSGGVFFGAPIPLSVPKIRFCNIGDEGRQGQAGM